MTRRLLLAFGLTCCITGSLPAQQFARSLVATEDARIAGVLSGLRGVLWLSPRNDGRLIVAQSQDHPLKVFELGATSSGLPHGVVIPEVTFRPSIFRGWVGDTLWAFDARASRVIFVGPDNHQLRAAPLLTSSDDGSGANPAPTLKAGIPLAVYSDGSMLLMGVPNRDEPAAPGLLPLEDGETAVVHVGGAAKATKLLGVMRDGRCFRPLSFGGMTGSFRVPFCGATLFAVSPDGKHVVFATPDSTNAASPVYHIVAVGPAGDTLYSREMHFLAELISPKAADSIRSSTIARMPAPGFAEAFAKNVAIPVAYPALQQIISNLDGSVWLGKWITGGTQTWLLLDLTGQPIGSLTLPATNTVAAASSAGMWTTVQDSGGTSSLVHYHIRK